MIRIWADFNAMVGKDRISLSTMGSRRDLEKYGDAIREGLEVLLHMDDEFEVRATLEFENGRWYGMLDWSTIRYLDEEEGSGKKE